MRWYGKEITVARAESFAITCELSDQDGMPFRISEAVENPCFCLTISNTMYKGGKDRYVLNCWTPLLDIAKEGESGQPDVVNFCLFKSFDIREVNALPEGGSTVEGILYKLTSDDQDELNDIAYAPDYYVYLSNYTVYQDDEPVVKSGWCKYRSIFTQTFLSSVTKDWVAQSYYYELRLLGGTYSDEFLAHLADGDFDNFDDNVYSSITNEFIIIPKTQLNVLSKLGGYNE